MDGKMSLSYQGYNWLFLTTFDCTIIFHLKNYLPCLVWCHYFQHILTCVTVQLLFFILAYYVNTMDLKSQNNIKSE